MPTIIVVGQEKNFAALRPRLFGAKVSNKTAGEVAAEIRAANPHANLDRLTPGTVLRVPAAPSVRVRGDLSLDETTKSAIEGVANHGKSLLADLAGAAEQHEKEAAAERKAVLKALDSVGTGTAVGRARDKELAKDLESARKALGEEEARAKERSATLQKAQAEWTAALDELRARLGD